MSDDTPLPDKLYFKIGEVARLVGVKPYVLRYWESEFASVLRPGKTEARHRLYRRKDVETLRTIKRLLHEERYTIEGARRKLRHGDRESGAGVVRDVPGPTLPPPPLAPLPTLATHGADVPGMPDVPAILARIRQELREICRRLEAEPGEAPPLQIG